MVQKKLLISVFCMIGLIMAGLLLLSSTPVQAATYVAQWTFDEGTGNIVNDSSGNGHTGTINGAVWGNGITGKCLMFDGSSYVQIPRVSDLDINGPITISAWVKPMVTNETMVFISKALSSTQGYDMGFHNTAGLFGRVGGENNSSRAVTKFNVLKANEWQHVAVTFDGATAKLYYNGTMVASNSVSSTSGIVATDLYIGKPADRYSLYFKGWMDEVKIANTCLNDQTILAEYNSIKCGTGLLGRYFDNQDLTNLKMVRVDPTVNYDWGYNAPCSGMGVDSFSIRWSGEIQPKVSGIYTFYTTSDDGVKLTIANRTIIDKCVVQPSTEYSGNIYLTANEKYKIDLIYFDNSAGAKVKLEWFCPDGQPREIVPAVRLYPEKNRSPYLRNGLNTEYANEYSCERCNISSVIDFDWGTNAPYPTVNPDGFYVVWSGFLQPTYSGTYTFYTTLGTGDTASLKIADKGVGGTTTIDLVAGQVYPFRLLFADNLSNARIKLEWSCNGVFARQLVPSQCFFYELGSGLMGSYYDEYTITNGSLTPMGIKKVRIDPQVNFNWGQGSPEPGIGIDTFAVEWTGCVETNVAGEYTFYTISDDGVQLNVYSTLIINDLTDHAPAENTGKIKLEASYWIPIRLLYYDNTAGAQIKLEWSGPGFTRQPIPTEKLYPNCKKFNEILWNETHQERLAKDTWTYSISPGTLEDFAGRKAEQDAIIDMAFNFWESVVPLKFTRVDTGGEIQINFIDNCEFGGAYANAICGNTITFANKFKGNDIDWNTPNRLFTTGNHELAHILGMIDMRIPDNNTEAGYRDKVYYAQRLPYNYSLMDYDNPLGIFFPALCGYDIAVMQGKYGVPDHNPMFRILVNNDDIPSANWEEASLMIRLSGGGNATDFYGIIPARPLMDTKPIYRFRVNYGTFTDNIISSNPDFNSTAGDYLGEIYTVAGSGRVPLYLYCKQTGQHFMSTTYFEPGGTIASRVLLGYITPKSAM